MISFLFYFDGDVLDGYIVCVEIIICLPENIKRNEIVYDEENFVKCIVIYIVVSWLFILSWDIRKIYSVL